MKILRRLIAAFIVGFGLDGISKVWAEQSLVIYEPVPIFGDFFRFTLGYNTGIAFGRGKLGFVAINIGAEAIDASLTTGMQAGHYCNVVTNCEGERLTVNADGLLNTTLAPMRAIAIHTGSRLD